MIFSLGVVCLFFFLVQANADATYAQALNRSIEYIRDHAAAALRLAKPLVLEEFGLS